MHNLRNFPNSLCIVSEKVDKGYFPTCSVNGNSSKRAAPIPEVDLK